MVVAAHKIVPARATRPIGRTQRRPAMPAARMAIISPSVDKRPKPTSTPHQHADRDREPKRVRNPQREQQKDLAARGARANQKFHQLADGTQEEYEREQKCPDQRANNDFTNDVAEKYAHRKSGLNSGVDPVKNKLYRTVQSAGRGKLSKAR